MACFSKDDMDWVWGSLKPWQILHSTLAERERSGNAAALDVWELVNQTLGEETVAANYSSESIGDLQQKATGHGRGWSHGIRFLADDGEFWRHGGVLESRVREWLSRRDEELIQLSSSADQVHHSSSTGFRSYCSSSSTELAIASSSSNIMPLQKFFCNSGSADMAPDDAIMRVAADEIDDQDSDEDHLRRVGDMENEAEDEKNAEDDHGNEDDESVADQGLQFAANYEDDQADHDDYSLMRSRARGCTLVINRCCRAGAPASLLDDDHYLHVQGGGARLAAELGAPPDLEEEMEVCAVCLEQLNDKEAEMMSLQALACRHVFHRACIEPWLERQPHACSCPCCRAPVSPASILERAPPLPIHSAAGNWPTACAGQHGHAAASYHHDIMGLLSDMEAALEHFGFRS